MRHMVICMGRQYGSGTAFYSGSEVIYSAEKAAIEQIAQKESYVNIGRSASQILRENGCFSMTKGGGSHE